VKPSLFPLPVHDLFKWTGFYFPKTPGSVVLILLFPVYEQDPAPFGEACNGHLHGEA
jgi:hypothetical protein